MVSFYVNGFCCVFFCAIPSPDRRQQREHWRHFDLRLELSHEVDILPCQRSRNAEYEIKFLLCDFQQFIN